MSHYFLLNIFIMTSGQTLWTTELIKILTTVILGLKMGDLTLNAVIEINALIRKIIKIFY